MKSSGQWFAGGTAASSLAMPWLLGFFLLKRWYFNLPILKILCRLLQNMRQCYFGVAEDVIKSECSCPTEGQSQGSVKGPYGQGWEKRLKRQPGLRKQEGLGGCLQKLSFHTIQVFHSPKMTVGFFHFILLFLWLFEVYSPRKCGIF